MRKFSKKAKENVDVDVEIVGERPCAGKVNEDDFNDLIARADKSVLIGCEKQAVHRIGSTDSNIPLSLGIPSVCVGACKANGVHTREEYLELDSLENGMKRIICLLSDYFEGE